MSEILQKLSSYNIFNYLLPGIVFAVCVDAATSFTTIQSDIILGVFVYYLMGLIISRIGSVIIEPVAKKMKLIQYADYKNFITASAVDTKIELLSEVNNMYRTLFSTFICILGAVIAGKMIDAVPQSAAWLTGILWIGLIILFALSWRKQTEYVTKRVDKQTANSSP